MVRWKAAVLVAAGTLLAVGIASASETVTYSYDAKGRLVKVVHTGSVNNDLIANYTFDGADNRKNLTVTGAP